MNSRRNQEQYSIADEELGLFSFISNLTKKNYNRFKRVTRVLMAFEYLKNYIVIEDAKSLIDKPNMPYSEAEELADFMNRVFSLTSRPEDYFHYKNTLSNDAIKAFEELQGWSKTANEIGYISVEALKCFAKNVVDDENMISLKANYMKFIIHLNQLLNRITGAPVINLNDPVVAMSQIAFRRLFRITEELLQDIEEKQSKSQ